MNAPLCTADFDVKRVDLLDAFKLRAEARALLWSIGEIELGEAVDILQRHAVRDGLVARIGRNAVQGILADAFEPYCEAGHGT